MKFNLERLTRTSTKSLRTNLERLYSIRPNLICRQQLCGYYRYFFNFFLLKDDWKHLSFFSFFTLQFKFVLIPEICSLKQLLIAGSAAGVWAYNRHKQKTNVHIMALNLVRGVPLTPKEKETMLDILTPPRSQGVRTPFWWRRWLGQWSRWLSTILALAYKDSETSMWYMFVIILVSVLC